MAYAAGAVRDSRPKVFCFFFSKKKAFLLMPDPGSLTDQQQKWFASVREGLERETGRTLAQWAELARACPEPAHRKRLAWMKEHYGLGQNRASMVLNAAFPPEASWAKPAPLAEALWADPTARAIHDAVREAALALPGTILGQRKGFTAFSRNWQFAAIKPAKRGVVLGLAVEPDSDPSLLPAGREGWSERLLSRTGLDTPADVTPRVAALLRAAWERS